MVGAGHLNMPDGEIATAPVADSLDGQITFEFPGVLSGRLVEGIRLCFRRGELVEASAEHGEDWLHSVLATDVGASRVGEFGIGTNLAIDRFCKDILLDEKIGGTVHIALGRAYPECGGTNQSAIHWDIVKDTRQEGTVYVDGTPVLHDGALDFGRLRPA
jgi:aminopeptidase